MCKMLCRDNVPVAKTDIAAADLHRQDRLGAGEPCKHLGKQGGKLLLGKGLPYREVDLDQAARNVLTQDQFAQDGGEGTVASWRNTATIRNVHPNTTVAFRMNNLSGSASDLTLYAYGPDGKLVKVAPELWSITDETGAAVTELTDGVLYELRVTVADGGDFDLSETEKEIKLSVVLGK